MLYTDTAGVGNGPADANSIPSDPPHIFEVTNDNGGNQCVRVNSYGQYSFGNNVHYCRYYGTLSAPSAIGPGAYLMSTGYRGYDGSSLSQSSAAFQVVSTEQWTPSAHGARFQWQVTPNGSVTRKHMMELDGNSLNLYGNVGVGAEPAAWHANYRVVELGTQGTAVRGHATTPELTLTSNAYYDTAYRRGVAGGSSGYQLANGAHSWLVAASGAAGSAISFTVAMTLSQAGALSIGKDISTGRSISATGTINASGADYAEYVRRSSHCGELSAGDIVGIDNCGELTDTWSRAVTFAVVSGSPGLVGGDTEDRTANPGAYELVAFSGRVPVNSSAAPGDHLVPVQCGSGISAAPAKEPTLPQYLASVGKVLSVGQDGRPIVAVKVG